MNNKIIKTSLIIAAIILASIGFYETAKDKVINRVAHEYTAQTLGKEARILAQSIWEGDDDYNDYYDDTSTGTNPGTFDATEFTEWKDPMYKDYEIYCIEPGNVVKPVGDGEPEISYADALAINGTYVGYNYHPISVPSEKYQKTQPHYEPIETKDLPKAAAYVVSAEEKGKWTQEKQKAIWNLRDTGIDEGLVGGTTSSHDGSSKFDNEVVSYADYDAKVRNNGLQATDNTNLDEIKIKVNQNNQEYIVGPFNINYVNGAYGNIAFSGITEITLIGYNSKKEVVSNNVPIEKFLLKNTATGIYEEKTLDFFKPDNDTFVDRTAQSYPAPGQDFQIVLKDSNISNMTYFSLKVKFKYMLADGEYTSLDGSRLEVNYEHSHEYDKHGNYVCTVTATTTEYDQQTVMSVEAKRSLYEEELEIKFDDKPIRMDLGGKVWEDVPDGKENLANGKYTSKDRVIPNVKVTLYNQDGSIATLRENVNEATSTEQIINRINPTYTDSNGDYLFKGLDPMKKYYVTFEYNGQIYLPTDYSLNLSDYNQNAWQITSKGTEKPNDRTTFNNRFKEIGSSPVNYVSSNSLNSGKLVISNGKYYNETFSQFELMGFTLDANGNYQNGTALVDGFYKIENGNIVETNTLQEGTISARIKDYVKTNKKYPDTNALRQIYSQIAGSNSELWKKLQFIEDCKIKSYTQAQGGSYDLYPVYNQFVINSQKSSNYETADAARKISYNLNNEVINGVTYYPIYPGQFSVNQGLWRRQEANLSLRKDVAYAATRINGKTEIYKYDNRTAGKDYWEVQLRMRDYNNYYASTYKREVYSSDYLFSNGATNLSGKDLELYVTYKITVRNTSIGILSKIPEIVDYYDKDYTYMDNLSWIMYKNNVNDGNSAVVLKQDDYLKTIEQLSLQGDLKSNAKQIKSSYGTRKNADGTYVGTSKYGDISKQDMEKQYNSVYIKGLDNKMLASGEEAYIYLTFKANKDENNKIILDNDDNSLKQNFVEINGYTTYYKDGTKLPNNQTVNSTDAAGLIDYNSNPGNLCLKDLQGTNYEKNFEDDTDRAKSIKISIDKTFIRSINGTVWEDERTHKVSDAIIGDGVRQDNEIAVKGVTVELVEKLNGKEFIWQTTKSGTGQGSRRNLTTGNWETYQYDTKGNNGYYEFSEAIPGDYIVRFYYGNENDTALTNEAKWANEKGSNIVSYNGQDFKSTVYQKDMLTLETLNKNDGKYDLENGDKLTEKGMNLSDAKDIWGTITTKGTRAYVDNYSSNQGKGVTNHIAEVLSSPYANTYNEANLTELKENTYVTAETDLIVFEGEYNRTQTVGDKNTSNGTNYLNGNDKNGNYTLKNLDFGITERPKAQLELNQKVTNVKVTLANQNTLFDTDKSVTDLTWTSGKPYELNKMMNGSKYNEYYGSKHRYAYRTEIDSLLEGIYKNGGNGLIQVIMDEEIMHGATIRINYELSVTNVSETDYMGQEFYYNGTGASDANKVTTTANTVLDYVSNNLQYRENDNKGNGWSIIKADDVISKEGVNKNLENTIKRSNNIILKTQNFKDQVLKPGETTLVPTKLQLTQLITTQNTADDKTYTNIAEITNISNSAGRRMAYSVQGNQDPTINPTEVDSSKSEKVVILPPFGIGEIVMYVAIAVVALGTLTVGIIFIKKKVLNK